MHGALRQLGKQSAQSGSNERSDVGRPKLGGDDGRVLQRGVRRQHAVEGPFPAGQEASGGCGAMKAVLFGLALAAASALLAQQAAPRKKLLAVGEEKGYRHDAVSHAMATIERLGKESGLWDTTIRTDTEALTKKKLEYNAKNLNDFDAVLFFTGGDLEMDEQQKADFLSFIHDDGKGFIGVHSATITWTQWPEYGEMIGGYFDEHPWNTFEAPIMVEDGTFPGMQQWPKSFSLMDEIYQIKNFSRENTRV